MTFRRLAAVLVALVIAGCSGHPGPPTVPIGTYPDAESALVAHLYAAALRYYGSPTRVETTTDPLTALDSGAMRVVPGFTGRLLERLAPDTAARADEQVYRDLVSALPEGIAVGDYTTSAEDKPAVAVTEATADAWGENDLTALTHHCAEIVAGAVTGSPDPPNVLGRCQLPTSHQFPTAATMFTALQTGEINAAWTTTAAPNIPPELVLLADRTALIRAQNLVPLYRRNELTESQVLALNQIAGVLDTAALVEMRAQVADGADPAAVADEWLSLHPPGR